MGINIMLTDERRPYEYDGVVVVFTYLKEKLKSLLRFFASEDYLRIPVRVSLTYLGISALWILVSDRLVNLLVVNKQAALFVNLVKGWLYVFIVSVVLYLLLKKIFGQIAKTDKKLLASYDELAEYSKNIKVSEDRLKRAQELAHVGNWELDLKTRMMWASDEAFRLYGIPHESSFLPLQKAQSAVHPEDRFRLDLALRQLVAENIPYEVIFRIHKVDGNEERIMQSVACLEYDEKGVPLKILGVIRDITEEKSAEMQIKKNHEELTSLYEELTASEEELKVQFDDLLTHQYLLKKSEERFRLAVEGSNDIIWDCDVINNTVFFSERWFEILGYPYQPDISVDFLGAVIHPEDFLRAQTVMYDFLHRKTQVFEVEVRLLSSAQDYRWFFARGKAIFNEWGKATRLSGSLTDITARKENELRIHRLAYNDALTGLPNRSKLEEVIKLITENDSVSTALVFIDLDNFKYINDTFGHLWGDIVLKEIGNRLLTVIEQQDYLFRLGGDEFAVLLTGVADPDRLKEMVERILKTIDMNIEIHSIGVKVTASIGVALFPEHGTSFEELLKNADASMYKAKSLGKSQYIIFNQDINTALYEKVRMESNLRNAINNNELLLYYQPLYCLKAHKICGLEALVRWDSPQYGLLPPLRFIPLAEETGLIIELGKWVLKNAVMFIRNLQNANMTDIQVSVNISVRQLLEGRFVEEVLEIINEAGIDTRLLELEITESVMMENIESNFKKIEQLRSHGISVALDDFGSGYSSLTYLKRLPITTLKVEKAFIDEIHCDQKKSGITKTVIMLAHSLDLKVVAEGVETKEQLDCLADFGCDLIQGYYISKPLPAHEIGRMLNIPS